MLLKHIKSALILLLCVVPLFVYGVYLNGTRVHLLSRGNYFFDLTRNRADVSSIQLIFPNKSSIQIEKVDDFWRIKEADGYSFKNRLQLQKKSNIILDLAMFNGKNITIKLYAMSGNSNEIRSIELYKSEIIEQTALTSMSFDGKNLTSQEYTFNCDGSTYLIKDVDGVNVYGILIIIN